MKILNQLERKLSRLPLRPFYRYIVFAMGGLYAVSLFFAPLAPLQYLTLDTARVLQGEIWRLVTFLIIPPVTSPLYALFFLLFYYFIGTTLEARWGVRRFFLYYLLGALGAILGALLTGAGTNVYLNLSLFFAFALLYPDYQINIYFIFPIKIKWIAMLNALYFLSQLVLQPLSYKASLLFSLANLFLFFGGDIITRSRQALYQWNRRRQFKNSFKR